MGVTVGPVPIRVTSVTLAATLTLLVAGCSAPQGQTPVTPSSTVITSTTTVAGAGVLGNERRPDESCAAEPMAPDPGESPRRVGSGTERGDIDVPADPQRIVALSGDQLDVLCALGLQSRIVAAALPDGSDSQPAYLGTVVHELPAAGSRTSVDAAAITAAAPDLILGSQALTPQAYGELSAIAPTVFTGAPGADWRDNVRAIGAATGRADAAAEVIDNFMADAEQTGVANDATHFQASVVQFTEDTVRVFGTRNFPASVLSIVGVDRPAAQRFTDDAYEEIDITDVDDADLSAADGDIVYVSFDSRAAKDRATTVMGGDAWRALSATRDNRVFVVNNEVWQTGQGPVAARGILDDLRWLNAPIN